MTIKRLHLGCGNKYMEGWCNVDLYAPKVDVRADLTTFEYPRDHATDIIIYHVIEHLAKEDGAALLRRCFEWLQPGGRIAVECPDRKKCMNTIRMGRLQKNKKWLLDGAKGIVGGRSKEREAWHKWLIRTAERIAEVAKDHGHFPPNQIPEVWQEPGEFHLYVWTTPEMESLLREIGFTDVMDEPPITHGARLWRDMRVVGRKP